MGAVHRLDYRPEHADELSSAEALAALFDGRQVLLEIDALEQLHHQAQLVAR